jgi:hypothetical protein
MNILRALLRFIDWLFFGKTRKQLEEERRRAGFLGLRALFASLTGLIFIAVLLVAIVAKLVMEYATGDSFTLTLEGLLTADFIVVVVLAALVVLAVFRKLYEWRFGEEEAPLPTRPVGCGMVILVCIGLAGLFTLYIRHRYAASLESPASKNADRPVETREPEAPVDERAPLIARFEALEHQAIARWRADLSAAGAVGKPGEKPPMLEVTPQGDHAWKLKNLSANTVCVRLTRVVALRDGQLRHCPLDHEARCVELGAGRARVFMLDAADEEPGCANATLEYRVGTPLQAEPSWWTATALDDPDSPELSPAAAQIDWPTARLKSEIALLETALAETDRAARWRGEHKPPALNR